MGRIHTAALQLSRAERSADGLDICFGGLGDEVENLSSGRLDACCDIEGARGSPGGDKRPHDIGDVDVVTAGRASSKEKWSLAAPKVIGEDRDDAGLAVGPLPGTKDIAQTADRYRQ